MSLDNLPEELLLIIFQQLDLKSIRNLYDTGNTYMRTVICTPGVIKACNLSLSSMATALTLKTNFFKNISTNLIELDLSAIKDLTKTALLPVMRRMSKLVTLNVTYTKITLFDFVEIYDHCPSLKNICVNFVIAVSSKDYLDIPIDTVNVKLQKCQEAFTHMENIQFVGSVDTLTYSQLPQFLLHKAKIKSLTFILASNARRFPWVKVPSCPPIVCNTFGIYNLGQWRRSVPGNEIPLIPTVQPKNSPIVNNLLTDYEYIYISAFQSKIQCSPVFKNFFTTNSCVANLANTCNLVLFEQAFNGHILSEKSVILFWNKKCTKFDNAFFQDLASKLKPLLPCYIPNNMLFQPIKDPILSLSDWILLKNPIPEQPVHKTEEPLFKKRRIVTPNVPIDLDNLLENKRKVELNIYFCTQHVVTLSSTSSYLKKLTFLKLVGQVRYSNEIFNVLFRCCDNLNTFDIEAPSVSPCVQAISRSVALSRSLKNLRIVDKTIDFNTLFSSLSQCRTLENIILVDESFVKNDIGKPNTLIKQCENLYYLCIEANLSEYVYRNRIALFNKCKAECERHHLVIDIVIINSERQYTYDPFLDVFRLNQIKVIK